MATDRSREAHLRSTESVNAMYATFKSALRRGLVASLLSTMTACAPSGQVDDADTQMPEGHDDDDPTPTHDLPHDSGTDSSTSSSDTTDTDTDFETETAGETETNSTDDTESGSDTETGELPPDMPMDVPPPQVIGLGKDSIDAVCSPPPNENDCYILSSWNHHIILNTDHVESYLAEFSKEGGPFEFIDEGEMNGSDLLDILWVTPPLDANVILKITLTGSMEAINLTTNFKLNYPWDGQWEVQ